jgi:hypothetical protein
LSKRRPGPPSTPLALGATIRDGWRLFTGSWASLTKLFLVIYVPLFLLRGFIFSAFIIPQRASDLVNATALVFIELVLPSLAAILAVKDQKELPVL